jgi:hypothetical protein
MIGINGITGINTFNIEQGTDDWRKHRAGVITASNAHLVIMDDKRPSLPDDVEIEVVKRGVNRVTFNGETFEGTKSACVDWYRDQLPSEMPDGKKGYMNELIGQVCTGLVPESVSFKQAEWGHMNEELARDAYEARNFSIITQAGLIYKDESLRCAISPDGLDMELSKGLEIKSPFTTQVHIDTILNGRIKPEYIVQCQYSMWVTGWDSWDFCSYDNRMRGEPKNRLHVITVERDEEMMKVFDDRVPAFIKKTDEALVKLGFEFGDQWKEF